VPFVTWPMIPHRGVSRPAGVARAYGWGRGCSHAPAGYDPAGAWWSPA